MQPVPRLNPHIKPYCRARKYLRSDAQWINFPNEVATESESPDPLLLLIWIYTNKLMDAIPYHE